MSSAPPAPSYRWHDGAEVIWQPWRTSAQPLCPRARTACGYRACGYAGPPLFCVGLWAPPGDGRPDPPRYARLAALRCPVCHDQTIYDQGTDGTGWDEVSAAGGVQQTLF